jgi:hypothetical protein
VVGGGGGAAEVNEQVVAAAERRQLYVNAVDDPPHATAYLGGVVRRDGVTVAFSTERSRARAGRVDARSARRVAAAGSRAMDDRRGRDPETWKRDGVPMEGASPAVAGNAEPLV